MAAILETKAHFFNGNCCIVPRNSLKFVPQGPINNISSIGSDNGWFGADQATSFYLNQ